MPTFRGLFSRKDATRGTTPLEARLSLAGLFTPDGDLGVVPGVLSGLNVAGVSAAWHYTVSAGHVLTTRGAMDGATLFGLDGTTDTPTVAAAPGTGSRWDLIWVRHRDIDGSDADSNAVLGVTEGTPSGTPSKPYGAVPSGALVLAESNVAAGATGTLHANVVITSVTPRTAARGGIVPSPSAAQMTALDAIATTANPIWIDDAGTLKRSVGAGWVTATPTSGTYTPTLTRATLGNGTVTGWWSRVGNVVTGGGRFLLGSTSAVAAASGSLTVGVSYPPVAPAAFYAAAGTNHDLGTATLLSTGVQIYLGRLLAEASATEAKLYCMASSPVQRGAVNATTPFTFKSTDVLSWSFQYLAA